MLKTVFTQNQNEMSTYEFRLEVAGRAILLGATVTVIAVTAAASATTFAAFQLAEAGASGGLNLLLQRRGHEVGGHVQVLTQILNAL